MLPPLAVIALITTIAGPIAGLAGLLRGDLFKSVRGAVTTVGRSGSTPRRTGQRSGRGRISFNMDLLRKVDSIGLSNTTFNFLRQDNFVFIGDFVQKTEGEMLRTPNCSLGIMSEMVKRLASIGLHLGMEIPDWPPENIEELLKLS